MSAFLVSPHRQPRAGYSGDKTASEATNETESIRGSDGEAPVDTDDARLAAELHAGCVALKGHIHNVIVGQDAVIDSVLCCMLAGGHCIVQGVPGLAKTLLAATGRTWRGSSLLT